MKAKYIFTKFGYHKNDLMLSQIIPETEEDYDVADIFLSDYYSDDGETAVFEAEDLENAVYQANLWFKTCAAVSNLKISDECKRQMLPKTGIKKGPYIPSPVKLVKKGSKREKKYYGINRKRPVYHPDGLTFNYVEFSHYKPYTY